MRWIVWIGILPLLAGCSPASTQPNYVATHLDVTSRTTARYHALAEHPASPSI